MKENPKFELRVFLHQTMDLLRTVNDCRQVLFAKNFRIDYVSVYAEVSNHLETNMSLVDAEQQADAEKRGSIDLRTPSRLELAGLAGEQLKLKLRSFEESYLEFEADGGIENLERTLSKAGVVLGSLAGAIPGFGSFAQELIDFIIKELKKRYKFWGGK